MTSRLTSPPHIWRGFASKQQSVSAALGVSQTGPSHGRTVRDLALSVGGPSVTAGYSFDLAPYEVSGVDFQLGFAGSYPATGEQDTAFAASMFPNDYKVKCWDVESVEEVGAMQLAGGGASAQFNIEIARYRERVDSTYLAFPTSEVIIYHPYGWPNNGGATWVADAERMLKGKELNTAINGMGVSCYLPLEQVGLWPTYADPLSEWLKSGVVAHKAACVAAGIRCIAFWSTLYFNIPGLIGANALEEKTALDSLEAMIAGGADELCLWDSVAYFWGTEGTNQSQETIVAEQKRGLNLMRQATGLKVIE